MPTVWAKLVRVAVFLTHVIAIAPEIFTEVIMKKGRILSVESMGLVDGPGIRTVIFFKGCPLRCLFCHNPDSWDSNGGELISSEDLMKKIIRFRPYFERSGGGVTFSGGEPLLQKEFLTEMLQKCKENGIHTCLDTCGAGVGGYEEILSLCDLVLYDVKATDEAGYKKMCRAEIAEIQEFTKVLSKLEIPTVVRQVVIPGINDSDEYMQSLKNYIKKHIPHAHSVELLPYHKLGEHKYKTLNLEIELSDVPAMDKKRTDELWEKHFKDYERR